jgi:hypothetical protein
VQAVEVKLARAAMLVSMPPIWAWASAASLAGDKSIGGSTVRGCGNKNRQNIRRVMSLFFGVTDDRLNNLGAVTLDQFGDAPSQRGRLPFRPPGRNAAFSTLKLQGLLVLI